MQFASDTHSHCSKVKNTKNTSTTMKSSALWHVWQLVQISEHIANAHVPSHVKFCSSCSKWQQVHVWRFSLRLVRHRCGGRGRQTSDSLADALRSTQERVLAISLQIRAAQRTARRTRAGVPLETRPPRAFLSRTNLQ